MVTRDRLHELLGVTPGALRFIGAAAPETIGYMIVERLAFGTPRPQLICLGADDRLTPGPAVERALADTQVAYSGHEHQLEVFMQPGVGHAETLEMRRRALHFFRSHR